MFFFDLFFHFTHIIATRRLLRLRAFRERRKKRVQGIYFLSLSCFFVGCFVLSPCCFLYITIGLVSETLSLSPYLVLTPCPSRSYSARILVFSYFVPSHWLLLADFFCGCWFVRRRETAGVGEVYSSGETVCHGSCFSVLRKESRLQKVYIFCGEVLGSFALGLF